MLATASTEVKDAALLAAADLLLDRHAEILAANADDVAAAEADGRPSTVVDRLRLSDVRLLAMANGLRAVAGLPDPGRRGRRRVDAPQRPAGRSGSGCRSASWRSSTRTAPTSPATPSASASSPATPRSCAGSSGAIRSNIAIAAALREGLAKAGLPHDSLVLVEDTRHEAAVEFMRLRELDRRAHPAGRAVADPLGARQRHRALRHRRRRQLPRLRRRHRRPRDGGRHRRERQDAATVGVQRGRDAARAPQRGRRPSSPTSRRGSRAWSSSATTPPARSSATASRRSPPTRTTPPSSSTSSWPCGSSTRSTPPSPTSPATAPATARPSSPTTSGPPTGSCREVDAAAVLVNASTRFVDGEELGFGAEIGISTQKLHARGPMGLRELTTLKFVIHGEGQIRSEARAARTGLTGRSSQPVGCVDGRPDLPLRVRRRGPRGPPQGRLPVRRGHRRDRVPGRPARQADPRRGPGRHRARRSSPSRWPRCPAPG